MYNRHRSQDNTGDFSCSRQLLENRVYQCLSLDIAFYVDTALKLTECTTDIEVIIKRVISVVPCNFWKLDCSSNP